MSEKKKWSDLSQKQRGEYLKKVSGDMTQRNVLNLIKKSNAGKILSEKEIAAVDAYINGQHEGTFNLNGVESAEVFASDLANVLGISERRIQQLANEGVVQKTGHGRYKFVQSIHEYVRYLQSKANKAVRGRPEDRSDEKTRKTSAEAELLTLKLLEAQGKVVQIEEVERVWLNIVSSMRQRLLTLPTKIPPYLEGVTGMMAMKEIIQKNVYEVMNEIAEVSPNEVLTIGKGDAELQGSGSGDAPSVPPSTDPEGKRVG